MYIYIDTYIDTYVRCKWSKNQMSTRLYMYFSDDLIFSFINLDTSARKNKYPLTSWSQIIIVALHPELLLYSNHVAQLYSAILSSAGCQGLLMDFYFVLFIVYTGMMIALAIYTTWYFILLWWVLFDGKKNWSSF